VSVGLRIDNFLSSVAAIRRWKGRDDLGVLRLMQAIRAKRTYAFCIWRRSVPVKHPIKCPHFSVSIYRRRTKSLIPMPLNNQTERSEPEQAETFNRVTNLPPQTQQSRERPSTPQHYRDNPDLLKSVFEWSPERTPST
jgi:hypothetical protein